MKLDKRKKVENIDFYHFFDFDKLKSFDRFNTEVEPVRKDVDSSHQRWAHSWENSPCVCIADNFHTSCHTILLIFGQKLDIDILRPLTRPDFW